VALKLSQKTVGGPAAPQAETPPPIPSVLSTSKDQEKEAEDLFQKGKKSEPSLFSSLFSSLSDEEQAAKYAQAAHYYELAANMGHSEAQLELGWLYDCDNDYAIEKNEDKAVFWYKKAAEQDNLVALRQLSHFFNDRDSIKSAAYRIRMTEIADENEIIDEDLDEDFYYDSLSLGKELWESGEKSLAIKLYRIVANTENDDNEEVREEAKEFLENHGYDW